MKSQGKSDFSGLVKYICDKQEKLDRVNSVNVNNCAADSMDAVISEVLATQQCNTRATGDKTYHLVVSFPVGENPSLDTLKSIEAEVCSSLGYSDHQRVSAVHTDTDNLHIHIAINKIHPEKYTMHDPFNAYRKLGEVCSSIEDKYGLKKDNHEIKQTISQNLANDMERHSGIESLTSWIKKECTDDIRSAKSWSDLHKTLNESGLEIIKRGNGFVIQSNNGLQVKASSIARDFSKSKLESKLGIYEESELQKNEYPKRSYKKRSTSFRINTTELYRNYQQENAEKKEFCRGELAKFIGRKNESIDAAKRSNRLRRAAIKLLGSNYLTKKILYSQAHNSLKKEIESINKAYTEKKNDLYKENKKLAWADWLKKESLNGNNKALDALRSREQSTGLSGNTISASGSPLSSEKSGLDLVDNITKKGTVIFNSNNVSVRDDGVKLKITTDTTPEAIKAAMDIAVEKYGNVISLTGTPKFKAQVTHLSASLNLNISFTDKTLERHRKKLINKDAFNDNRNRSGITESIVPGRNDRGTINRNSDGRNGSGITESIAPGRNDRGTINRNSDGRNGSGITESIAPGRNDRGTINRNSNGRNGSGITESIAPGRKSQDRNDARDGSGNVNSKPNVKRIGSKPPSFAKNGLRTLSSLYLVRFSRGSEVLLPSDAPSELEHERAKSNNKLRWGTSNGRLDSIDLADKYILEREEKRSKGFDIPKHKRYNNKLNNPKNKFSYAGIRNVEGQKLALLKLDSEILVMPINESTAKKMKKLRIGEVVLVDKNGSINKLKGIKR